VLAGANGCMAGDQGVWCAVNAVAAVAEKVAPAVQA
jgi:hypothetical protein